MDTILNSLGLKYTVRDSTMDVMQLEVADRALLTKVLSDSKKNEVSHSSSSESYAAIGNGFFRALENEISQKFKIVVVLKPDSIFDKPMDLTIRTDNIQNVIVSLKDYGIKTTTIKKPFPVYLFERKKQSFDSH
ncbi:hypothetical protein ABIB40_002266 [Pedobacter sp. UYP30]|uniref:hypothetical protein n=1 Tax=Pedobacter sp. UYP30 TaxID=1756400 RepID=UPI0033930EBA